MSTLLAMFTIDPPVADCPENPGKIGLRLHPNFILVD
jgi:hypothetical protein